MDAVRQGEALREKLNQNAQMPNSEWNGQV